MKTMLLCWMVMMFSCLIAEDIQDTLILQNGDKITGEIKIAEGDVLIFNSLIAGEIKVPLDKIVGIESNRTLYIRLENGNVLAARPGGIVDGKQVLHSTLAGQITVPRSQMLLVGPTEDSVNPGYLKTQKELKETQEALANATEINKVWSGYLQLNFSGTSGNTDSMTFASIAHVERKAHSDKFEGHLDMRYGESNDEISAQEISGYLRETVDITGRLYVYGRLEGKWDEVKDIDFSAMAELGFGLHLIREKEFEIFEGDLITLDFDLGVTYTATDFEHGEDTHSSGGVARIMYNHIFPNKWRLAITGEYVQDFQEPQNKRNADQFDGYRCKVEVLLEIPITEVLSFTGTIKDEYVNAPAPDRERNDFYWLLGLKVNL